MAFVAGQKVRVSDLSGGTGSGSTVGGGTDVTTADVTVNNSTSFVDSGLAIDVVASATYELYAWLRYTGGNTPDFKVTPTSPSGTTGNWSLHGNGKDTSPATDTGVGATFNAADIGTSLTVAGDATGTLSLACLAVGSFTTTTAGTFKLRIAQRTATASNTILKSGSFMKLNRLA
jgi:hypothetical protein